ncbi:hypothetical protein MPSI1_000975 [Malassezia psittaci]|uniref:BHLH domain-containing protein n=1 Tax=Malassezia psittaci TaxID=1821823 RepID=A0AAF0F440_9BASI|nr:hypothetical protein MPSI1_000975 [Malassezia psittaci]
MESEPASSASMRASQRSAALPPVPGPYEDFMVPMDGPMAIKEDIFAGMDGSALAHPTGKSAWSGLSTPNNELDYNTDSLGPFAAGGSDGLFSAEETSFLSRFLSNLEHGTENQIHFDAASPTASTSQVSLQSKHGNSDAPTEQPAEEHATPPKRQRHIVSEQRRRNQIRSGFTRLSELLDMGRQQGARALGLNSGAGTGVEDEDLDDRTDNEEDLSLILDEEETQRRKRNAQRRARSRANTGKQSRGRGRGRGRGGSAGGSGSKSAVLFQVIDLLYWLNERNAALHKEIAELENIE